MGIPAFDSARYRKVVLAAIDARGGPEHSDPFEMYDIPLDEAEQLPDAEVAARVDDVWAFWQKQRDHPKYRGSVTAMLALHPQVVEPMCERTTRAEFARRAREVRAHRDEERFAELDAALRRLIDRFGTVPEDRLEGLRRLGAAHGLSPSEIEVRVAPHRAPAAATAHSGSSSLPTISEEVYQQVRADLSELARLDGADRIAGLFGALGLPPTASPAVIAQVSREMAGMNRSRRPDRRRALVDDLLAAVDALLVHGSPDLYLDRLARDVTDALRPEVAVAVLIEDELVGHDRVALVARAVASGLDEARAADVVDRLAAECTITTTSTAPGGGDGAGPRTGGGRTTRDRDGSSRSSTDPLRSAREALRAGRPLAAGRELEHARAAAGGTTPPIRHLAEEVDEAVAEAGNRWRQVLTDLAAKRVVAAKRRLDELARTALDVPGPEGQSVADVLSNATSQVEAVDAVLAGVRDGSRHEIALVEAMDVVADHDAARAELVSIGVAPPSRVVTEPSPGGGSTVTWEPSTSPGTIRYRVARILADGGTRAAGTTLETSMEDGLPGVVGHVVTAWRAGVASAEATSAPTADPPPPVADQAGRGALVEHLRIRPLGRRVRLAYPALDDTEIHRMPAGREPPPVGSPVAGTGSAVVPPMGPGLAVDRRPGSGITHYVAVTGGRCGARTMFVGLPPVTDLRRDQGLLRWTWPAGCTEVIVATRLDRAPDAADDPLASARKVTNARYEVDGGVQAPEDAHVGVFTCLRRDGALLVASIGTSSPATAG